MSLPDTNPIVVAPTPTSFTKGDAVDYDALARNIERWLKTPLSGFVLGTANGEELSLSEDEKVNIVRVVSEAHAGQKFVIAGIDNPSTTDTLRLAERYADAGADMVRVRIPRGLPPDAVRQYFGEVTSRSPVPVVVIHQTFSEQLAAPPEVIGEVCALDNVFGYITDHNIRFEGHVRPYVPLNRKFWICNGGLLLYGALLGADGACMWLGNIAPALCIDIMAHGCDEEFAEARPLQAKASRLDMVIGKYGVAGVKAALELLGFEGMRPRAPRAAVDEKVKREIETVLKETGIF